MSRARHLAAALLSSALLAGAAHAAPIEWGPLTVRGTHQIRFAHLANQFRAGAEGDDNQLALRTDVDLRLRLDIIRLQVEIADMRAYGGDDNTPLNAGMINPLDVLQANAGVALSDLFQDGDAARLRVGRVTLDLGSRRLMARNRFRTTINAFDGAHLDWKGARGDTVDLFAFAPVTRLPDDAEGLEANRLDFDAPQFDQWLFGGFTHLEFDKSLHVEGYVFVLDGPDGLRHVTPGFRLVRPPAPDAVDADLELAIQHGSAADGLDQRAAFGHVSLGYTFPIPARPRVRFMYDWASGDRDPDDGVNNRFDPLGGVARPELGPTGLYTAFTRRNVDAPGIRVEAVPHAQVDLFVDYRRMHLDQARDAWVSSKRRDPSGLAGDDVGNQLEVRVRWHLLPKQVSLETGFAWLDQGEFAEAVHPGAADPMYGYLQANLSL